MFARGNAIFSISEIKSTYPNQWVAIDIVQTDEDGLAASGEVIFHDSNEQFVWSAVKLKEAFEQVYVFYTGTRRKMTNPS
jgi:hypothetical protein